jgi:hypothetical protein
MLTHTEDEEALPQNSAPLSRQPLNLLAYANTTIRAGPQGHLTTNPLGQNTTRRGFTNNMG